MSNHDDDAIAGEVVDDDAGAAGGWGDDDYVVDETASPTVEGKLDNMGKELRRLTRASLVATLFAAALLGLTDLWNGGGFHNSVGFLVGGGLSTLNLWILAGGYYAMVDQRAVVPRLLLAVVGSMVVMFGVALYVIFAKREWTLGFALGLAVPALGGILYGVTTPKSEAGPPA